ncbi:carboxypeptidase-like regulatory domain-containing protein [Lutibacter citreus]|uniref:carboxypeptidase-like regulatory domain-containing protein n=1 Tax=Lutibacter citreus TaxID=2138210 RepID=UPI0013006FA1|nr:carboxypeptidase-like regulatory domain-containing protein [Lutibacter citreus]
MAQTQIIKGKVTAFKKFPLKGVNITAKKSKEKVMTDSLGLFSISCKKKDMLRVELDGFEYQYVKLGKQDSLNFNMIYRNNEKSYQSVLENNNLEKSILDYCVENLLIDNNNFEYMTSIFEVIQSVCPGARISDDTGSEKVLLITRGPNSFFADPYALLVVDGIVVDEISSIQPIQVETIKVLIGNEAGHWGVRGGNGAVEITLKKGSL